MKCSNFPDKYFRKKFKKIMNLLFVLFLGLQLVAPTFVYAVEISPYVYIDAALRENLRRGAQTNYAQNTMQATIENAKITQLGWQVGSETTINISVPTHSLLTGNGNDWIARIAGNSWMGVTEYRHMYYGNSPDYSNAYSIGSITATSSSADISVTHTYSISNHRLSINLTVKRLRESTRANYPISIVVNNLTLGSTVVAPNQNQNIFPPQNVENVTLAQVMSTIELPTEQRIEGAPVTVRYVDDQNNNLADPIILSGGVGESWKSEEKSFANYELVKITGAREGVFTTSAQETIYQYQRIDESMIEISTTPIMNWHKEEHSKLVDATYYARASSIDTNERIDIRFPNDFWQMSEFQVIIRDAFGEDRSGWFEISSLGDGNYQWVVLRGKKEFPVFTGQTFVIEVYGKLGSIRTMGVNEMGFFEFGTPRLSLVRNNVLQTSVTSTQPIQKKAAILTVNHVDIQGDELIDPQTTYGIPGDAYETEAKEFDDYSLKEVIGNAVGEFYTEEISHVTFIYEKRAGIIAIQSLEGFDFDFGEVKTSSRQQVVTAKDEVAPRITITDYSNVTSWSLQVSVTPFLNASGKELPVVDFSLSGIDVVETVHQGLKVSQHVSINQEPVVIAEMKNPRNREDGMTILQVGEVQGNEVSGVSLTLPSNTPMDRGVYYATMTWELIGDPTLGGEK